ncbi:MAG: DUF2160 family membrane protein [Candidatus Bathyarchaeia archaeon]
MGILPFKTSKGERVFVGIITTFGICLLWLRFIEPYYRLSIWIALLIGIVVGLIIYKKG